MQTWTESAGHKKGGSPKPCSNVVLVVAALFAREHQKNTKRRHAMPLTTTRLKHAKGGKDTQGSAWGGEVYSVYGTLKGVYLPEAPAPAPAPASSSPARSMSSCLMPSDDGQGHMAQSFISKGEEWCWHVTWVSREGGGGGGTHLRTPVPPWTSRVRVSTKT